MKPLRKWPLRRLNRGSITHWLQHVEQFYVRLGWTKDQHTELFISFQKVHNFGLPSAIMTEFSFWLYLRMPQ